MDYKKIREHIGHEIVCVGYAGKADLKTGNWQNVAIECETCNEVLISYDRPTKK